jgi:hypothetical protein
MTTKRPEASEHRLSRRDFLRTAQALAGGAAAFALGCGPELPDDGPPPDAPDGLTLGGAPDTHHGWTLAAFCDTVVPGAWRDPEGRLGAVDVGAVAPFFDDALPAAQYIPVLVMLLDSYADDLVGSSFVEAAPEDRDEVLDRILDDADFVEFAVQLAKLSFYATHAAAEDLGFPGANPGWVGDPDFTFGVALSDEITEDGNLP